MPTTNTLTWNKNTEPDVAKYTIYRKLGSAPTKVPGDILKAVVAVPPSIPPATMGTTDDVTVDGDWFYGLTVTDLSGNESGLSNVKDKIVDSIPPAPPVLLSVV